MFSRWVRLFVAVTTALVAWLVAAPAYASAPLCDVRGATAIAPAPQLQEPMTSLDVAAPDENECSESAITARALHDGRAPVPASPIASSDSVVPNVTPEVFDAPVVLLGPARSACLGARDGDHARLDRPPRV
jgi:hypothetical protein